MWFVSGALIGVFIILSMSSVFGHNDGYLQQQLTKLKKEIDDLKKIIKVDLQNKRIGILKKEPESKLHVFSPNTNAYVTIESQEDHISGVILKNTNQQDNSLRYKWGIFNAHNWPPYTPQGSLVIRNETTGIVNLICTQNSLMGMGVLEPKVKLHVRSMPELNGAGRHILYIEDETQYPQNPDSSYTIGGGLSFRGRIRPDHFSNFAGITGIKENCTTNNNAGALILWTVPNGNEPKEGMRITSAGNVGIGTKHPQDELHVKKGIRSGTKGPDNGSSGSISLCARNTNNIWKLENDGNDNLIWSLKGTSATKELKFGGDIKIEKDSNNNSRKLYFDNNYIRWDNDVFRMVCASGPQWEFRRDGTIWFYNGSDWVQKVP